MKNVESITSPNNQRIKNIVKLEKAKQRKEDNVFVIEGLKEIEKASGKGYKFESVFFCEGIIGLEEALALAPGISEADIFKVSKAVFEKMAYRENSGGLLVVAEAREHVLDSLALPADALVLLIEGVEKPGNLGAILRTADAAGLSAVIVCDPQADLYNPNVVRASLGCVFTVPMAVCSSKEAVLWLKKYGFKIYTTHLHSDAVHYDSVDFKKKTAVAMGTEATGLSAIWLENTDQNIVIPMKGEADSLNVSTSAAIIVYEACRQRGFR